MFCMNCGNKLEDDSRFCTSCGASIKGTNDAKVKQDSEIINKGNELISKKEDKKVPWGVITIGAVIIGVIVLLVNIHTCDWCKKTYVGAQYYDMWDTSELMCEDCALQYYMGPEYKNYKK